MKIHVVLLTLGEPHAKIAFSSKIEARQWIKDNASFRAEHYYEIYTVELKTKTTA